MTRKVFLICCIFEALRSGLLALSNCDLENEGQQTSRTRLRERILKGQLSQYGLDLKWAALDDLKGCLVQTPFGSSIYVHEELRTEDGERVALHELGHFLCRHRPSLEYYISDPCQPGAERIRENFTAQEREADAFADLWQHVLAGLVDYILGTRSNHSLEQRQVSRDTSGSATPNHVTVYATSGQ